MAYRSGTYIAFDGLGEVEPTKSDFKYYATIRAWTEHKDIDFKFVNSHEKTAAVRDTSLKATLQARIRERLANSKNVVVILSDQTRKSGSMLSYEIEQAVDKNDLPLICAYTGYSSILNPSDALLRMRWPLALEARIDNNTAKAIHIPFRKDPILDAISQFTVHTGALNIPLQFYNEATHRMWGLIS
ncbi:MAG: hypothetical protein CMI63_11345 [Parvularcula sp.]|uniref:TIR domain-containing protein n=1 Tax=Hyphococcus sp. TaxID=2038636 RepID=UPI000C52846B|nr:hypothetical protein [Parvularcula sp.]